MRKRGDFSVSFLLGLIIALAGFAIIAFVYYEFFKDIPVDTEVCHTSVIFRATLPSFTKSYVPLKCYEDKVCITGKIIGKGECDEFEGAKSFRTVRVGNNAANSLDKIQKVYAREILNCWSMMGEGKVSLFSNFWADNYGLATVYPSCVICSRIAVDEDSLGNVDFSKMDLRTYMATHLVPGTDKSYFQYMAGENAAFVSPDNPVIEIGAGTIEKENEEGKKQIFKIPKDSIPVQLPGEQELISNGGYPSETAVLFMQISAPDYQNVLTNLGGTAIAGGIGIVSFPPARYVAKAVGVKVTLAILAMTGVAAAGTTYYNQAVTASKCGEFTVGTEARSGCSSVKTVGYDAESILEYCSVIESIP